MCIRDSLIAGNVIEKAERIEAWMGENPESERMPEVKQALMVESSSLSRNTLSLTEEHHKQRSAVRIRSSLQCLI